MTDRRWDLWQTPDPPSDFAERVLLALDRDLARRSRRRRLAMWTASVCAPVVTAIAAGWAVWVFHRPALPVAMDGADGHGAFASGECQAESRTELELSSGMSAVLERGAHVRWSADRIDQDRGDVFYRASRSQSIRVRTPAAEISGRGPAYRVKVPEGAEGTAAAVLVSVAQGTVAIESGGARRALGPGQYARVERNAIRTDREDDDGEIAMALASERVRNAVEEQARKLERRAASGDVPGPSGAPAAPARPPRRIAPPPPIASHADPLPAPSVPHRPPILPRCDCDPRAPLCSCGSE